MMITRILRKPRLLFMVANHLVYILQCGDGTLYTGYTTDLDHRLKMHASGKGAKYTRGRGPFIVVFTNVLRLRRKQCRENMKSSDSHVSKSGNSFGRQKAGWKDEYTKKLY